MDFNQVNLIYRGEGNANFVLALPKEAKVLRLRKSETDEEDDNLLLNIKDHVAYWKLMRTLLDGHACNPELAEISPTGKERLNEIYSRYRSEKRSKKKFRGHYGILFPDVTILPRSLSNIKECEDSDTYSIELKPKQGWKLQELRNLDLFDFQDLEICRFCAMQYTKVKCGRATKVSDYCPIKLFSGDRIKMKSAVISLLHNPQNNLRIFKNGSLLYGEFSGSISLGELKSVLSNKVFSSLPDIIVSALLNGKDEVTNAESTLPSKCILNKILQLQRLSQETIEFMSKVPQILTKTYNYLEQLVSKHRVEDFTPKEKYMIGATALDCSLIITFQEFTKTDSIMSDCKVFLIENNGAYYKTLTTVIDLDPKPESHFLKYISKTNNAYRDAKYHLKL